MSIIRKQRGINKTKASLAKKGVLHFTTENILNVTVSLNDNYDTIISVEQVYHVMDKYV